MRIAILAVLVISLAVPGRQARAQSAPPTPPRETNNQRVQINGCYDLFYTNGGAERLVGRLAFDTTSTVMQGQTVSRLRFIGGRTGFGAPRGTWTSPKGDSVSLRVTFIDSGILLAFPKFATDTMRGTGRGIGLTDTTTAFQARAVRQSTC